MNNFNELYEFIIDEFIDSVPLRNTGLDDAISVNRQLVNRVYDIRRGIELQHEFSRGVVQTLLGNLIDIVGSNVLLEMEPVNGDFEDVKVVLSKEEFEHLPCKTWCPESEHTERNSSTKTTVQKRPRSARSTQIKTSKENPATCSEQQVDSTTRDICGICVDEYTKNDPIVVLPCKHYFHTECIRHWLCNEKVTCPLCRFDVRCEM